ncbi:MAG: FliH/SctL family protein [bacterium]|nr:FliH/SctL family protein [Clostridium sp.]MCM1538779.1 FliH/SctL family protein [bacterium]
MYKSLIKSNLTVVQEEEKIVIDTNELIAQKLKALSGTASGAAVLEANEFADQGMAGAEDDGLSELFGETPPDGGNGFTPGIQAETIELIKEGPSPEELLAQAREEIAQMQQDAVRQIEQQRETALAEAKREGYDAGYAEGMHQVEQIKAELAESERQMAAAYEQKIDELEPLFIEKLTGIYEHIFKVNMTSDKQVLLYLAENVIRNVEGNKEFFVHVSKEDYAAVNMQKKQLEEAAAGVNTSVEVVQDTTLSEGECMIETDGGIFDCGLGTQLAELKKQLLLLAYSGV